jgi:hypothetical protein
MSKIPTAEEYFDKKYPDFEALDSGNIWVNIEESMIEFARLHVQAALEAASEKAIVIPSEEDIEEYLDKDSIINAYLLTNIK